MRSSLRQLSELTTSSPGTRSRPASTSSSRSRLQPRLAEVRDLMSIADDTGRVLMPGHTFLYSPPVRAIKELIDAGELGDIYFVSSSRVNLGLHQTDVSVVWDLGPHDFSILRYWLDELPAQVSAVSRACIIPENARRRVHRPRVIRRARSSHVRGLVARPEQATANRHRRLAEDGRVRRHVDRAGADLRLRRDRSPTPAASASTSSATEPGASFRHSLAATEPLALELQNFAAAILRGEPLVSSAEMGLDVDPHDRGGRSLAAERRYAGAARRRARCGARPRTDDESR